MGHHITALITKLPINQEKATAFDVPVFHENGYAIIGLDPSHTDYWTNQLQLPFGHAEEIILDCPFTHYLAHQLDLTFFAIISTNYFGGSGEQLAVVYKDGVKVPLGANTSINAALRALGVEHSGTDDEFDTLRLGKYRHFDNYFEKYWEER